MLVDRGPILCWRAKFTWAVLWVGRRNGVVDLPSTDTRWLRVFACSRARVLACGEKGFIHFRLDALLIGKLQSSCCNCGAVYARSNLMCTELGSFIGPLALGVWTFGMGAFVIPSDKSMPPSL